MRATNRHPSTSCHTVRAAMSTSDPITGGIPRGQRNRVPRMRANLQHQITPGDTFKYQLIRWSRQFSIDPSPTMHPKACFALFALGLALAQAVPASRIEKKSVSDEPAFNKNLKPEELGDDKERAKKSTFCMDIKDKAPQMAQLGPVQTLNLMPQGQVATQVVPQMSSQVVPQMSSQMSAQLVPQMQAYSIPAAASQNPVQTVSVIHTQSQPAPAPQTVVIPQPVQPIHTLQIIQPSQPCPQQPNVNIVQPPPSIKEVNVEVEREVVAPVPQTTPQPPPKYVKPQYKPEKMVVPYAQYMDVSVVPMAPVCKEQLMVVPQPTVVKVPHCPHQGIVANCNCRTSGLMMEPIHTMALRNRLMGGHALLPRQANLSEEKKDAQA